MSEISEIAISNLLVFIAILHIFGGYTVDTLNTVLNNSYWLLLEDSYCDSISCFRK